MREKIGVALSCKRQNRDEDERDRPWQGFHLARYYADRAFADIKKDLDAYTITDTDWPVTVKTPSGEEVNCWEYYAD